MEAGCGWSPGADCKEKGPGSSGGDHWRPHWPAGPTPPGSTRACPDADQRFRQQLAEVFQSSLDGKRGGSSPARPRERWEREAGAARCWLPPRSSRSRVLRAEQDPSPAGRESSRLCSQESTEPPRAPPEGLRTGASVLRSQHLWSAARSSGSAAGAPKRARRSQLRSPVCSALVTPGLSLTLSCPCDISGF